MLTSLWEGNTPKCHKYYPDLKEQLTFRDIEVYCPHEEDGETYIKKQFIVIRNTPNTHKVGQNYFHVKILIKKCD